MNTLEAIRSRKSVRNYTGEPATDKEMSQLLTAAYAAPIGMGKYDSLSITVIKNKDLLSEIDTAAAASFGRPGMHPLYGAPTLIVVSSAITGNTSSDNVACSNAAIVVQNIALAATELGIGTCHIWGAMAAVRTSPELTAKLNVPEGYSPLCGITVGKTDETYTLREIPENRINTVVID